MHTFSARDTLFGYESHDSRQMLDNKINKFWISEDFSTSDDAVLRPGEYTSIKIRLEKKLFPKQLEEIRMGIFKQLEISMRSCFAQSGIHILGNIFDYININDIENLDQNGFVDIGVNVINRGLADVEIKKTTPFFRLYFRPNGNFITGTSLYNIIKDGKLKIEG